MTAGLFRGMLVLQALLFLGVIAVTVVAPAPAAFEALLEAEQAQRSSLAVDLAMFAVALASLVALVGLYLFRAWGRSLGLWSTVASFALLPFMGTSVSTGLQDVLLDGSTLLWGATLAAAYWSDLRARFTAAPDSAA